MNIHETCLLEHFHVIVEMWLARGPKTKIQIGRIHDVSRNLLLSVKKMLGEGKNINKKKREEKQSSDNRVITHWAPAYGWLSSKTCKRDPFLPVTPSRDRYMTCAL